MPTQLFVGPNAPSGKKTIVLCSRWPMRHPRLSAVSVAELLEGKRVCVCGGSGGVGKTTTSAAIALGMAARGAKVAGVTIDPARRLANALGLQELHNEPRLVAAERLAGAGPEIQGELG